MSQEDIEELVKAANEATKELDSEVRTKAFEIVLNHLLAGGAATKRRSRKAGPAVEYPKSKATAPTSIKPIPVDLKGKGGKSLREFYKEKAPKTQQEKLTVFVYYLSKTVGVEEVLPGHVLTCYNEVSERKPEALKQLFTDTIGRAAYLERGKAPGCVMITITGENLVEHDLPKKKAE